MSDNPYRAPETSSPAAGVLSGSHDDVRSVAKYQKGILICILVYLMTTIGQFAVPLEFRIVVAVAILAVGLVGAVFVFLLAMKVYGTPLGIFLGVLSLLPLIGLIVLLMVNGKATRVLKQNGIKVGLLGADISSI